MEIIYLVCYVYETGIIAFIYLDELIDLRTNLKYLQMVVCPTAEKVKSFFLIHLYSQNINYSSGISKHVRLTDRQLCFLNVSSSLISQESLAI